MVAKNSKTKSPKNVRSITTNKGNKENEEESTNDEHNLTMAGFEKVTEWLGRQAEQSDEILGNRNTSLSGQTKLVVSRTGSSIPGP